jgi:hypothetical protein
VSQRPPKEVSDSIRSELWKRADQISWARLSDSERSALYEQWTTEKAIGGILSSFIDPRSVRVYIKDTLMKPYIRHWLDAMAPQVLERFGLNRAMALENYIKPHGRRYEGGIVVCWGNSRDWKDVLMSSFERKHHLGAGGRARVALIESGHTQEPSIRTLINDGAICLEVDPPIWIG